MGSSNRHWPSMFKSKPSNHHEFNSPHFSSSPPCKPFPSPGADGEERTPEPKPRWNPKPEQIRILEAIFNSGMVNPPREEIKKIRGQLQEYGQVGDANVFYWFQNRKSRSKQKNRQLLSKSSSSASAAITPQTPPLVPVVPSSSSSSSDRSSPNKLGPAPKVGTLLESPTNNNHQHHQGYNFNPHQNDAFLHQEVGPALPFFFPGQQNHEAGFGGGGLCYNELTPPAPANGGLLSSYSSDGVHPVGAENGGVGTFSELLLGDMIGASRRSVFEEDEDKLGFEGAEELSFMVTNPTDTGTINIPLSSGSQTVFSSFTQLQGEPCVGGRMVVGPARSTVFINDVSFEVPAMGPFNLREVFGEDVVLLHQSGHPVPTNEWGITLHPLQHGACYYLARTVAPKHHHFTTNPHNGLLPASEFPFQL